MEGIHLENEQIQACLNIGLTNPKSTPNYFE